MGSVSLLFDRHPITLHTGSPLLDLENLFFPSQRTPKDMAEPLKTQPLLRVKRALWKPCHLHDQVIKPIRTELEGGVGLRTCPVSLSSRIFLSPKK